jgi:hypothetical protein
MGTKVRILTDIRIDGVPYAANQVVDLPVGTAKAQESAGLVDAHKDAVAYCINELGTKPVVHEVAKPVELDVQPEAPAN